MPTYAVTVEGSQYRVDAPDENTAWQWAYLTHTQGAKPVSTERTTGEAVSDTGKQIKAGIGAVAQFPGQLYGLATGDFSETGLYGWGKRAEREAEEAISPAYKAREAARAAKIAEAEQRGELPALGTAFMETVTDPGLLVGFLAKNAPQLLVPGGAAAGVGRAALRKGIAAGVEKAAAREAAVKAGTTAAKGVGAAMQGADVGADTYAAVYERLQQQGTPAPEAAAQAINIARASGASAAIISWLAQNLPGASKLEETLAGKASPGVFRGALSTAAGETFGEIPEEVGGQFTKNLALRTVDPTQRLTEKLGETGAMAAVGAIGLGGTVGGLGGLRGEAPTEAVSSEREAMQQRVLAELAKREAADQKAKQEAEQAQAEREAKQIEQERRAAAPRGYTKEGQANLFAPKELEGIKRPAGEEVPAAAPAGAPMAAAAPEQLALPLDAARTLDAYEQERAKLKELPQKSPEVRARIAELDALIQPLREGITPVGYTTAGQGRMFTPSELKEAGLQRARVEEPKPMTPLTAEQLERKGQARLDFTAPPEAAPTPTVAEAPPPTAVAPAAVVPEPKLAPKRLVPAEFQPTIDKLTLADVRPETMKWAVNGRNRPFLRKLMDMAPEAAPEARKALKLEEGSAKAEVFDALFPQPEVPAFRPATGEGKPGVGVSGKPGVVAPKAVAPRAGEPVGGGVVPAERAAPTPAQPEGRPAAALTTPPVSLDKSKYRDTRGGPDRFHGTGKEISELSSQYALTGDSRNIYGQGFYTTDALDISQGYAKKGGPDAKIYSVSHKPVKLFNMDAPLDAHTKELVQRAMGDAFPTENAETGKPLTTLREIYDEFRRESQNEGLSRDDVQDVFDDIRYNLEQQGYRGFEHTGGGLTGKKAHNVKIFWDPEADVTIAPADLTKYELKAAEPPLAKPSEAVARAYRREKEEQARKQAERKADAIRAREQAKREAAAAKKAEAEKAKAEREAAARKAEEVKARKQAKRKVEPVEVEEPSAVFGESDKHPEWAAKFEPDVAGKVVYSDGEGALLRGFSTLTGQYVYAPVEPTGRYRIDVDSKLLDSKLSPELAARLRDAKARLVAEEAANLRKYPDGPFTNAKSNVVASETVDSRYSDYLATLMQDLGLGDVKVFLLHPEDVKAAGAIDKYKLYADYASAQSAGMDSGEDGSLRAYGPKKDGFYISIRPGLSETRTLETIAHELGHLIQRVSYDNASSDVKAAIKTEYEQWLQTTKGASAKEVIQSLRNRETAESHAATVGKDVEAKLLSPYWTSFSEWFADNVSKWATTDERPISVVEKFFKSVADKLRALVGAVTGQRFAPAKSVAEFLNNMGPTNPVVWSGTADTTSLPSRAVSPTEGIAEKSELMKDQPGPIRELMGELFEIFTAKDDVPVITRFRARFPDAQAALSYRFQKLFDGEMRDNVTKLANPEFLNRAAEAAEQQFTSLLRDGSVKRDPDTGQWVPTREEGVSSMADVYAKIANWAEAKGMSFKQAHAESSKMLEAARLNSMLEANKESGEETFTIHKLAKNDKRSETEQIAVALRGLEANPQVKEIGEMMRDQRNAMIDKLVEVGFLSKETAEEWKKFAEYVPFDRLTSSDQVVENFRSARFGGRGLAQLRQLPKLIGTKRLEVGNTIDNNAKLLTWMFKQLVKQDATSNSLHVLTLMGEARELGFSDSEKVKTARDPNNVVETYRNGRKFAYEVKSKWDVLAFKEMGHPKMAIIKAMAAVSQLTRKVITALPPFIAKQVTDDVQRLFLQSGVERPSRMIIPAITNFLRIASYETIFGKDHPLTIKFARKGLVGDIDYNTRNPSEVILFSLGYAKRSWISELHHRLESITRASDLAMRIAIYDQTIKDTTGPNNMTGDVALASSRAREFINFRRRGASRTINTAIATIPFFNSFMQSNDVLLRAMAGTGSASIARKQAAKLFWLQAAKMTAFSLVYALANSDDDEYRKATLDQRANNWIVGGHKLPVPSEMAALFKVPVETVVSYMSRNGTKEQQEADEAVKSALGYIFAQFSPVGGRITPIPQLLRPVAEAVTNHSFVTGRPLVGGYQAGLPAAFQAKAGTSEWSKALAEWAYKTSGVSVSPILVDNSLRNLLGGVTALVNLLADQLINPDKPDRPLSQYWFLSQYLMPEVPQGPKEEFYDLADKVMPVKRALDELAKRDTEAAMRFAQKNEDKLKLAAVVTIGLEQLAQTREYIKFLNGKDVVKAMPELADPAKRKEEILRVERMENDQLGWLRETKAQVAAEYKK